MGWRAPRQAGIRPVDTTRRRIRAQFAGGRGLETSTDHLLCRVEGPKEERAMTSSTTGHRLLVRATSAIHRRNPRPRNVMAPKAGLLACGSSRRLRPSRVPCGRPVTRNGTAARRLQLRGQRRTLSRRTPPASRLSPTVMPEAGNLDRLQRHHPGTAVKHDIKISLYQSGG
jgi:hypothetical protein